MLTLQSLNYQSNVFTKRIKQGSQFDVSFFVNESYLLTQIRAIVKTYTTTAREPSIHVYLFLRHVAQNSYNWMTLCIQN